MEKVKQEPLVASKKKSYNRLKTIPYSPKVVKEQTLETT